MNKKIGKNGYRYIYFKQPTGWKLEHRIIMEKFLKRKLKKNEHVHHKNHNILDNRLTNLEVLDIRIHGSEHSKKRWAAYTPTIIKCLVCGNEKRVARERLKRGVKFCSYKCMGKAYENYHFRNHTKGVKTCLA